MTATAAIVLQKKFVHTFEVPIRIACPTIYLEGFKNWSDSPGRFQVRIHYDLVRLSQIDYMNTRMKQHAQSGTILEGTMC